MESKSTPLDITELQKTCRNMDDVFDVLKGVFRDTIQAMLEAEMDHHLGYAKHANAGDHSGNSRNGYSQKTLKGRLGSTEVPVPRDRNGTFEPQIVRKYETTSNQLEDQVITLYAKGMTTRDIEAQMQDLYGVEVSPAMVSKITDKVLPLVLEWQNRPLDRVYPIVYLDAIFFKVRQDHRILNKAAYSVLAITREGQKEILGIWMAEQESASFWLSVLNDLHSRGVEDILIACKDGLAGFTDAIHTVFPRTDVQLCVIHPLRNTLKFIPHKWQKALLADLKPVYQAVTYEAAEQAFTAFQTQWGAQYPNVIRSWEQHWEELTAYFRYPPELRRILYTTNSVEGYHRQLRKVTKVKTSYPTDDALKKILYLATMEIMKKWTKPVRNWKQCLAQFAIHFGDRLDLDQIA